VLQAPPPPIVLVCDVRAAWAVVQVTTTLPTSSGSGPTLASALAMCVKGFAAAQGGRMALALVGALVRGRSPARALLATARSRDTLRSSCCLGLLVGSNALWRCIIGAARGGMQDRRTAAVAGALCAAALLVDRPGRYTQVAMYLLVRAVHTVSTVGKVKGGDTLVQRACGCRGWARHQTGVVVGA
jgi:hypothetical protein